MIDVFVSYKREDMRRVTTIVEGLRQAGLSVWWDRDIPGGAPWRQTLLEHLEAARCVLVVWTQESAGPAGGFVHEEAGRARTRGVYLPVRLDAVEEPIGFGQIQSLDLVGWRGRVGDRRFKDVVAAAKALIAGGPRPRPTAPRRRSRVVAAIAGAAAMLAAGASVAADVLGLQGVICRAPGVRAVCREMGIGGVPGKDEEALWAAKQPGDCATLREYLGRFPRGTYADEAQRRLQASETVVSERWIPEVRHLPLTVRMGLRPLADEGAARQEALERASEDPRLVCEGFDAGEFRLVSAAPQAETWRCERRGSGVVCGFDGRASCHVEARHSTSKQICQ